jgi:hypothetical protein
MYQNLDVVKQELITLAPTSSRRKLEEYLDYGLSEEAPDPLDIPESDYIAKVQEAFGGVQPQPSPPPAPVGVAVEKGAEAPPSVAPSVTAPPPPTEPEEGKPSEKAPPKEKPKVEAPPPAAQPSQPSKPQPKPKAVTPMTPDRHSGRRFVNLLPSEGELVLPIRGERVIQTAEEQGVEEDVQEKAEKLQKLLSQIKGSKEFGRVTVVGKKGEGEPRRPLPPKPKVEEPREPEKKELEEEKVEKAVEKAPKGEIVGKEAQKLVEKLKRENEQLAQEIDKLKQEIQASDVQEEIRNKEQLLNKLLSEKEKKAADYSALQKQIIDLRGKLEQKQQVTAYRAGEKEYESGVAKMKALTSKPNIISGVIKDQAGNSIEGALLIIKDDRGEPVRALKTNALGQFILNTPLSDGVYTVEVTSAGDRQLSFDIISVEAKGGPIPPVEIRGR